MGWPRSRGRTVFIAATVGLLVALTTGTASQAMAVPQAAVAPSGPDLWIVRDEDSVVYLFGAVDLLRPDTDWRPGRVSGAFEAAREIWFESDPEPDVLPGPWIREYGLSGERPLSSLVTAREWAELTAAAEAINIPSTMLDQFSPWLASLLLGSQAFLSAGFQAEIAPTAVLSARAEAEGKPIRSFRSLEDNIRFLAAMPEDLQVEFLRLNFEEPAVAVARLDAGVAGWIAGDEDVLVRETIAPMRARSEALYQTFMVARNVGFADEVQALLAGEGTVLVVLSAGLLAGDDSVQKILEGRGVTVDEAP